MPRLLWPHPMRFANVLSLALCLLGVSACDLIERPPIERFFGTPYVILEDQIAGQGGNAAQLTPFLDEDGLLFITVRYSGGCTEHHFRLEADVLDASATVWLVHADNGEVCDGELIQPLVIQLPETVMAKPLILLVAPSGNEVVLRDGSDVPVEAP